MFVQYLLELNIKFVQHYVCVNVCFVCVLTKIKKLIICKFVNILCNIKYRNISQTKLCFQARLGYFTSSYQ